MALWFILSPIAACLVADEDYKVQMDVQAELSEPGAAEPLWSTVVQASMSGSLDHFQRGLTIWDLFLPGPFLATPDPLDVTEVMTPHLRQKLQVEIARRLSQELAPPEVDLAVVVGNEKQAISAKDVGSHAESFSKRPGKTRILRVVNPSNEVELQGMLEKATRDIGVRDLVFFYSGAGSIMPPEDGAGDWEAALALSLEKGGSLRISKLVGMIKGIKARSRTVLLDSGFLGKGGRALPVPLGFSPGTHKVRSLPRTKDLCLLSVCRSDEPGYAPRKWKNGVLTRFLLPNLKAGYDRNRDGKVTAQEIIGKLKYACSRKVRVAGGPSLHPYLSGDGVLWRGKPLPEKKP
jgi:hypothetical protein